MKKSALMIACFVFVCAGGLFSAEAGATDYRTHWIDKNEPRHQTMWSKAGRGVSNILLGWTEMAYQPVLMAEEGHRWPVALGGGLVKGIFYGVNRTLAGVYELVTFPVAIPLGYRPIIEPEMPFPIDRDVEIY